MTKLKIFSLLMILLVSSVSVSYGLGGWSVPNAAPLADAGPDQTASEGDTVILDGSGSSDPETTSLTYLWRQTAGPLVTLSRPSAVQPDFVVPEVTSGGTTLSFQLTVTDPAGLQASDSCIVTISFLNDPPVANAGPDQTVKSGTTVTLNAAGSSDSDDGIQSIKWTQISGTSATLSDTASATPSFVAPIVGVNGDALTFQVTITDRGGLQSTDSCTVNVTHVNRVPIAEAGGNQTVPEGVTATLNAANSTDPDGDALGYLWTQTSGPSVVLSDNSAARPTFTTPDVGIDGASLTFRVTVSDQGGLQSSDTCIVNVTFVNAVPVADAGEAQTVTEGSRVTLSAAKSADPDGNIKSYEWTQAAGVPVTLSSTTVVTPTFTAPDVGAEGVSLTFRVTVTDQGGLQSTDACIVNVTFVNKPPVADAGATQIVAEGSTATLSAANSTDPDGNLKSYLWVQTLGQTVKLSSTSAVNPNFVAPEVGVEGTTLGFRVTVTDQEGLQSTDTCTVEVTFVNEAPVAEAGEAQTVEEGSTVTLSAAESTDPDDGIQSYLWIKIAGPDVTLSDPTAVSPTFVAPDVGSEGISLTFNVTVTDQAGLQSSDACIVNVTFVNTPPVADAGADQTVPEGDEIILSAAASIDPDENIESYQWTQTGGTPVSLSGASEVNPTFTAPEVGIAGEVLTFQLTVTDQGGLQSTDTCTVSVTFVNVGPVAEAGEAQTVEEGSTVTLSAAGSTDTDDGIQSYQWEKVAGPSVTLSSTTAVSPTFVAPEVGSDGISLTFRVTVTDQGGLQSSDACIVNVTFINEAPVAEAGDAQMAPGGSTVTLNAGSSTDTDDGIESYLWKQIGGSAVTLSDASAIAPTFTAPEVSAEGLTLTFQVTVTDQGGLQSSDTCAVTISPSQATTVTLQWDTNEDADYYVVYWGESSKNYTSHSDNITSPTTTYTVTGLGPKAYYFAVKAFNSCGNSSDFSTELVYNLSGGNIPPVADAGADQSVAGGATVSLDGSKSTDPDDGIQSYLWSQVSGPVVDLASDTSASTTFVAPDAGTEGASLTFQLMVTDNENVQSTDTCVVTISFVNTAPVAEAGATQIVSEGADVTLSAAGSTDADDGIKSYLWEQTAGPSVALSGASEIRPVFTAPDVGVEGATLTFRVTVTDQGGLQSSDTCDINVSFVNEAPVAEAGDTQTVKEGTTVTLSAAGSTDPDDGIQSYLWTKVAGPSVTLSSNTAANPTFVAPDVGADGLSITFSLTVTDKGGLQSSDACIVNVDFINAEPVADAGANQIVTEGATVTLSSANSTDPDDGIASYLWTQIGEPQVTLSDASAANPTFTAPGAGEDGIALTFQVTVTDKGGLQSSDTCSVTVSTAQQGTASVTLQWDTNEDADYYVVYWGGTTKEYTFHSNNINSPTTTYTVTGLENKTYYFAVKAFNACGNSSDFSDEVVHNLAGTNLAPVASAGPDQSVLTGATVSLNGSGSSDADDGIKSYLWTQTSGSSVTLSSTSAISPTFVAPDVGTTGAVFTFQLTVTDNGGIQASDTCAVNVSVATSVSGSVTLQWDTNEDADYYVVYWGENTKNYTANSDNINSPTTSYTVTGLDKKIYYFAVKAFNACGNSSDFSDEITQNLSTVSTAFATTTTTGTTPTTTTGDIQTVTMDGKQSAVVEELVEPVSPESLISVLSSNPSIELFDSGLTHLEWLQIGWAEYNSANGEVRIATGDIDGDGEDEIILGLGSVPDNPEIPGGFFQILDHDFTHLAWGNVSWPDYNAANGETWPACGDVDGDGDDEIIIGLGRGGEGTIEIFDYDSSGLSHREWVASSWEEYSTRIGETRPASGDIDGDGYDEIVVGLAPESDNFALPNGYFEIFESNYTHAGWGEVDWPEYNSANGETWLTCGDIYGNGYDEIIAGLGEGGDGRVEIFEYQNLEAVHSAWLQVDWTEYNAVNGETRPGVADIDDDGKNEIIIGLGPVYDDGLIPGGRFQITDDDFTLLKWLQVDWSEYNMANGSTRPVSGVIGDSEIILMGLGKK